MRAAEGGSLYARLLGGGWSALDAAVRGMHCAPGQSLRAEGDFQIVRGRGWLVAAVARAMGLPPASESTRTILSVTLEGGAERWRREFERCVVTTLQAEGPRGLLEERFGLMALWFRLTQEGGALRYDQEGVGLRLGRWTMPLPGWLAPRVWGLERASSSAGCTEVEVEIHAPLLGRLVRYKGTMRALSAGGVEEGA